MSSCGILTEKGREKYEYDGCMFTYEAHSGDGSKKFWRCVQRAYDCRVRIHTSVETNEVSSCYLKFDKNLSEFYFSYIS